MDPYWGLLSVLCSGLCFLFSWKFAREGKMPLAMTLVVLGGAVLRLYASADPFLHPWDERYHALVAKNLMENPLRPLLYKNPILPYDYREWSGNHIWLHKQPFALWLIALSLSIAGTNAFAVRIPSLIFSLAGVLLTFKTGSRLFGPRTGYFAALLFAMHGFLIELAAGRTATDHIDVIFSVLLLAVVYLALLYAEKRKISLLLVCALMLGFAVLCKWLAAYLIIAPLLFIFRSNMTWRQSILAIVPVLIVSALVFLPWQFYIHYRFPAEAAWESSYNFRHLTEGLEQHGKNVFFHFNFLRIAYGELVYLTVIFLGVLVFRKPRNQTVWVVLAWFWVYYLFFTVARTRMPAYTLPAAPAVFIMTAVTIVYFLYLARRKKWVIIFPLLLVLLPFRYMVERVKPMTVMAAPEFTRELELVRQLEKADPRVVVFNAKYPVELMFYTGLTVYGGPLDESRRLKAEAAGFRVISLP